MEQLSKAQQEVVDKMREGWELKKSNWTAKKWWLTNTDSETYTPSITVRHDTATKLLNLSIIELAEKGKTIYDASVYRLTEQYKTKPE
jgi:uncharacterized iron-regulated protein